MADDFRRRRDGGGCDTNRPCTIRCISLCLPWMTDGIYQFAKGRSHKSNVINQLHPRGSISPALIEVSCSTSSVFFFLSEISFFLLSMMGLHALSAHVLRWPPHLLLVVIYWNRGVPPPPTRRVARVVSKMSPKNLKSIMNKNSFD